MDQLLATSSLGQRVFLFDPGFALGTVGSVRALIQVSAFISAAIWAVIVIKMRTGAGWARLTLAALGVVHILAMLTQLIEGLHSELPRTFLVLLLALSITEFAAISVMFHPAAAPYFRSDQRSQ